MLTKALLDFVNALELPPREVVHVGRKSTILLKPMFSATAPTTDGVVTAKPGVPSGFVDSGSLVTFVANVSAQAQADVLNSVLLAQLAANKKFDREKNTVQWYTFYRSVLENVGWVVQASQFEKHNIAGASATADKIVLEVMTAIATGDELAVLTTTLNAVKSLPANDNRIILFDHASHSDSNGNFQISSCAEAEGRVAMKIGAFYFSSSQDVDHLLWIDFSSSRSTIYKAAQSMTLNPDVYGQVRAAVVTKLGDNASNFVSNLDI